MLMSDSSKSELKIEDEPQVYARTLTFVQVHRAEQGHVPSQAAVAELYYWGARGVPRDQGRALDYFDRAAAAGDNGARCGAAVSSSKYLQFNAHTVFPTM